VRYEPDLESVFKARRSSGVWLLGDLSAEAVSWRAENEMMYDGICVVASWFWAGHLCCRVLL
jgi:hypothetical protein